MKPLLAAELTDPAKLTFPVYVSPKLDGIRALVIDGQLVSRTLKPIPNHFIRTTLSRPEFSGFDGELIAGDTFQETTGNVMREAGEPNFTFYVFDDFTDPLLIFTARLAILRRRVSAAIGIKFLIVTPQYEASSWDEVVNLHVDLSQNFEGSMIRSPRSYYKFGRSTEREGILLKLKNFKDDEAVVVGFEELMHNENEAIKDAFGRTKRSSSKKNLVPAGTMGSLILENSQFGLFNLGTGFDAKLRQEIWDNRSDYLGKTVKFRYQPDGTKNKPRIPSFQGFRDPIDIGEPD
jgi:DNA ligase-1